MYGLTNERGRKMANKIWVGITTVSTEKEGKLIAENLITNKLAACVNMIPKITSFFYWQGKLCVEKEYLLLIKTTSSQVNKAMNKIKERHSYQVPEIIFWPIKEVDKNYGQWVQEEVNAQKNKMRKSRKNRSQKLDIKKY